MSLPPAKELWTQFPRKPYWDRVNPLRCFAIIGPANEGEGNASAEPQQPVLKTNRELVLETLTEAQRQEIFALEAAFEAKSAAAGGQAANKPSRYGYSPPPPPPSPTPPPPVPPLMPPPYLLESQSPKDEARELPEPSSLPFRSMSSNYLFAKQKQHALPTIAEREEHGGSRINRLVSASTGDLLSPREASRRATGMHPERRRGGIQDLPGDFGDLSETELNLFIKGYAGDFEASLWDDDLRGPQHSNSKHANGKESKGKERVGETTNLPAKYPRASAASRSAPSLVTYNFARRTPSPLMVSGLAPTPSQQPSSSRSVSTPATIPEDHESDLHKTDSDTDTEPFPQPPDMGHMTARSASWLVNDLNVMARGPPEAVRGQESYTPDQPQDREDSVRASSETVRNKHLSSAWETEYSGYDDDHRFDASLSGRANEAPRSSYASQMQYNYSLPLHHLPQPVFSGPFPADSTGDAFSRRSFDPDTLSLNASLHDGDSQVVQFQSLSAASIRPPSEFSAFGPAAQGSASGSRGAVLHRVPERTPTIKKNVGADSYRGRVGDSEAPSADSDVNINVTYGAPDMSTISSGMSSPPPLRTWPRQGGPAFRPWVQRDEAPTERPPTRGRMASFRSRTVNDLAVSRADEAGRTRDEGTTRLPHSPTPFALPQIGGRRHSMAAAASTGESNDETADESAKPVGMFGKLRQFMSRRTPRSSSKATLLAPESGRKKSKVSRSSQLLMHGCDWQSEMARVQQLQDEERSSSRRYTRMSKILRQSSFWSTNVLVGRESQEGCNVASNSEDIDGAKVSNAHGKSLFWCL